jgi:zinc ribbon protein
MLELVVGILLAAGAVYFVLRPILRPDWGTEAVDREAPEEGEDPDDDFSPGAVAVRALKEIEFDRATGKLSDADYDELKAKYTTEAVAALRERGSPAGSPRGAAVVAEPSRAGRRGVSCPTHGPRPESEAQFCSECGRRLMAAPGFCARCGAALEDGAHYCHSCGARVAA